MAEIHVLSNETINRIAAGEVVERPVNVVKELTENAIDAGASAITVEIRGGGIDLIRVTDNGCGIEESQVRNAFRRHATSKIRDEKDLYRLSTLGFRGEALSSIAAVSQVEMLTRTHDSMVGVHATNVLSHTPDRVHAVDAAGQQAASLQTTDLIPLELTEVGAPEGTTVLVRNLFYNVPVRRRFLKTAQTEAGYITDLMQELALSHPDIAFRYRVNSTDKLQTSGNGNENELIYRIYGREMAQSVIAVDQTLGDYRLTGYLGRPEFSRASRSFEIFFVNGRILHSDVLSRGLEEGYRTDLMQHRFPFAVLHLTLPPEEIDVNVHPSKMEVRFTNPRAVYDFLNERVHETLHPVELIPHATFGTEKEEEAARREEAAQREAALNARPHTEQFEMRQLASQGEVLPASRAASAAGEREAPDDDAAAGEKPAGGTQASAVREPAPAYGAAAWPADGSKDALAATAAGEAEDKADAFFFEDRLPSMSFEQEELFRKETLPVPDNGTNEKKQAAEATEASPLQTDDYQGERMLSREHIREWRIVGQVFRTYWIIEYKDRMLLIDQHAAHEKVNFERLMKRLSNEQAQPAASQLLAPPIVVTLTGKEEAAYLQYADVFRKMGYEIEPFGESAYALRAVPLELYANEPDALLREVLDEILGEKMSGTPAAILYKIASMSCKAAVKGNNTLSLAEAEALIGELLSLDNPYHCPHGRPTMIVLTQKDLERKFKRIV